MNGRGSYFWTNGNKYTGEFLNGLRHGFGTLIESDGLVYEGMWEKGVKHGQGKEFWEKGFADNADTQVVYEGMWNNGKKNGKGTLVNADGATLQGIF